jgi:hypothetical protein
MFVNPVTDCNARRWAYFEVYVERALSDKFGGKKRKAERKIHYEELFVI